MSSLSSWLSLVGLGAFHGLNPAMGWLFAVALGMHRRSRRVVLLSVLPIALGHALAISVVLAAVVGLGSFVDQLQVRLAAGTVLIGWAIYHALYGRRHRVRVGMSTGMVGLVLWSFLMAMAHGAGLMLVPLLMPVLESPTHEMTGGGSLPVLLAVLGVHTLALLLVTGVIALIVYEWAGVGFLRRGWINLDLLWTAALLVMGGVLLLSSPAAGHHEG
ncbi:MAG: hypothetical protein WD448_04485 [Woeseia sp.]